MNLRRRLFVAHYLGQAKGNGTLAANLAGYRSPRMAAARLMTNDDIRRAIVARLDECAMSANEVLARLSDTARSSFGDFLAFGPGGEPTVDLNRARRRGKLGNVKRLKVRTRKVDQGLGKPPAVETTVEVELHDPMPALALLAKYHGLLDRIDLSDAADEDLRDGGRGGKGAA